MSESSEYRVVYVEPGEPAVEKRIGASLEDLQEAVGGSYRMRIPSWG